MYSLPPVVGTTKESNKRAAPAFTMLGKEKASRLIPFVYPGPGYYEIDDNVARKRAPKFSMRRQLKPLRGTNPPGPGTYCPERVILNALYIYYQPYILLNYFLL